MILNNDSLNLGFGNSQTVSAVKNGYLTEYTQKTLGEAVDGFIGNAKWTSITGTDGNKYVNIKGNITYDGEPAEIILQYKVNVSTGYFEINAIEINGQSQSMLTYMQLIMEMYK